MASAPSSSGVAHSVPTSMWQKKLLPRSKSLGTLRHFEHSSHWTHTSGGFSCRSESLFALIVSKLRLAPWEPPAAGPNPRHSLYWLLTRLCSHICDPPHSLHVLLMRFSLTVGADARPQTLLARAPDAVMLAYACSPAFLAPAPAAVMLAYLRSPAFLAPALDALVGADARPQALLARDPAAILPVEFRFLEGN